MKLLVLFATFLAVEMASSLTAIDEFSNGNLKFTADLYKEVLKEKPTENFIFSPLSIEIVLALTRAGSKGQTEKELTSTLKLPNEQRTEEALKQLLPAFKSNRDDLKLLSANKLYVGDKFQILNNFKHIATSIYDADIEQVNFAQSQQAANTINQWVEQQTNDKIKDLLSRDDLDASTRLVLVNALYFSGKWETPFETILTSKGKFFTSNTQSKEVDMMRLEDSFRYYECAKCNARFLELPYLGENISMTIALPNEKEGLSLLEANIEDVLSPKNYQYERVAVTMPRWSVESSVPLKDILQKMGLTTIFSDLADLSGISNEALKVDNVVQKAFINVTESGTEAAAATAVITKKLAVVHVAKPNVLFTADHPFIYFITYNNIVLFIGQIV